MTAEAVWKTMGSPKWKDVAALALKAQKAFLEWDDPIAKETSLTLVKKYFDVLEFLKGKDMMSDVKALLGPLTNRVELVKGQLHKGEEVFIAANKTATYKYNGVAGEAPAVVKAGIADKLVFLLEGIAEGNMEAIAAMTEHAKSLKANLDRWASIRSAVYDITKRMNGTFSIRFSEGAASVAPEITTESNPFKKALKGLQLGEVTKF
jgi:hypothetical protein